MDLNDVAVFVRVVRAKSFKRAASELQMPPSTVSAKVATLERRLGVTLIRRTTRKLFITPEGQAFFERSQKGLAELEAARAELASGRTEPQGRLRITAPVELGSQILRDVCVKFSTQFPKVRLELFLADRTMDLVGEGVDLAIRSGELKDSSLVAKKIGSVYFAAMASPSYLKNAGVPKHPNDLASHDCLHFLPFGQEAWDLKTARTKVRAPIKIKIAVDDLNTIKAFAMKGSGIALLPNFMCSADAKAGKLVRVLPEWSAMARPVHLVYPAQKFISPQLRAFIDMALQPLSVWMQTAELD